ncbi:MAG: hypothetical protein WC455_15785 [Dehalococcoidia bacterium]
MKYKVALIFLILTLALTFGCAQTINMPSPATSSKPLAPAIPAAQSLTLSITSITQRVNAGNSATLVAQTKPGAQCDITVTYKSGPSTASGLYSKTADSNGRVSWTWTVGSRTTSGTWPIVVTATSNGKTVEKRTSFTVQ